jgi:hypothetical protein
MLKAEDETVVKGAKAKEKVQEAAGEEEEVVVVAAVEER